MLITDGRWVPWALDTDRYTLVKLGDESHGDVRVDLEQCHDAPGVLDWVLQIDAGELGDQATVGLIRSLDDILEVRQNICRFAQPGTLTTPEIHRLVDEYVRRSGVHE